jgi:hypothetical protein
LPRQLFPPGRTHQHTPLELHRSSRHYLVHRQLLRIPRPTIRTTACSPVHEPSPLQHYNSIATIISKAPHRPPQSFPAGLLCPSAPLHKHQSRFHSTSSLTHCDRSLPWPQYIETTHFITLRQTPNMLAFKVESWIWYGIVLFVAFSRLYVTKSPRYQLCPHHRC